ncbi:response regulator [Lachnotalea sp. AF33-28]|uniref:response regulator n=1 Tax=Lachnotalea sp. AF33-28 TaxID=2292046 RepID=UPI000E4FA725|nr:response regulator [Lachnotalea sp. AF33-28]RHP33281.1 response regulator [Lachnotalea sp. AF33-28]
MGLTVLVVDDDPNTVRLIEDSIPWSEYGIDQVYSAYQGAQALELVAEHEPDIVISDIEMPQMDGIRMLERLAERIRRPQVIFLTCHDNFSFAQKALRYDVSAYLLKPFRLDELSGALLGAVLKCRQKQEDAQIRKELADKQRLSETNQDYLVQNFILQLLNKTLKGSPETLAAAAERRKIPFDVSVRYYLLYVGVNMNNTEMKKISEHEFYFIFRNLSTETVYGDVSMSGVVENTVYPYYILIMPLQENMGDLKSVQERCSRLIEVAEQYLGISISCAISPPVMPADFGDMKKRMDELFMRERTSRSKVMMLEKSCKTETVEGVFSQEDALLYLRERNKTRLLEMAKQQLLRLDIENRLDVIHMQALHHDFMQLFYGFLFENHIQAYQLFQNETFRELNANAEYSTVSMIKYISYMFDSTFAQIDAMKKSDSVIARVKKYIREHFRENISRDDIAASIYMTPNYLSKVFHEETGMALWEYINICRVEEAKRLMRTTGCSMTEIALMVGFENIPYFSTVFKKYCNMTPTAWKSGMAKTEKGKEP